MKKPRGNIILTALFIAIFLFFLSVALIWTNRQDIALSLSMEHKLKAQSAARSAAYEAFYRLRKLGELQGFGVGTLGNGASYDVKLIRLEASGRRGEVLQVQARGKSGPVTSYLTLHLLETNIAGEENKDGSRVLFFPGAAETEEESEEAEEELEEETSGQALFGEFVLEPGGPGLVVGMKANAGPAFVSEPATVELPSFSDWVPVFDGAILNGWGPLEVVAPEFPQGPEGRTTALRVLRLNGEAFEWEELDPPLSLGDPRPENTVGLLELAAPDNSKWTTGSVLAVKTTALNFIWTEEKPPTQNSEDIEGEVYSSPTTEVGPLVEWKASSVQQKFATRGAIFPVGEEVYSHGWHYLYRPHDGTIPPTVTFVDGSTLTRWPCVLKYNAEGAWEKAWTGLKDDGSVQSEIRPDPDVLLVSQDGKIYSATRPVEGEQRRLLVLEEESLKVEGPIPDGQLVMYKDEVYLVTGTSQPALRNLLREDGHIDFDTLPATLPEIAGEVVDVSGTEKLVIGMGYSGEPLDSTKRLAYTARPRIDLNYALAGGPIAVEGEDLWAVVNIVPDVYEPTFEKAYEEPPYTEEPRTALARYDGTRWHILPHGVRECLKSPSLAAPGAGVIVARYPGLPKQVPRYAIVSVDTNPF